MSINVIYSTEAILAKNTDPPGKQCERSFASLEEAKAEPFPKGCVFAFIPVEAGYHVYSATLGWELHTTHS